MAVRQYLERLPRYLSMRQMRMLAAVAEHGSVLKASRALRVAQPSLSRTLTDLEATLGVRLFERSARGMTLTVFGEALLRRVKTIFAELRDAEEDLQSLMGGWHGHVHVGCTPLFSAGVLPRLLSGLMRLRPGLGFSLVEADSEALPEALRERNVDIALGRLPAPGSRADDLDYELLFEERLLLVVGTEHRLARRPRVSLKDLSGESWGLPMPGSMLYRVIAESFTGLDRPVPSPRVQADSVDAMAELVEAGDLITLVPASHVSGQLERYRLKVIHTVEQVAFGPVGLIMLRARQPTPAMNVFAAYLRSETPALLREPAREPTRAAKRARAAQADVLSARP